MTEANGTDCDRSDSEGRSQTLMIGVGGVVKIVEVECRRSETDEAVAGAVSTRCWRRKSGKISSEHSRVQVQVRVQVRYPVL